MCNKPRPLHTLEKVTKLACFNQCLALTSDGKFYFWGASLSASNSPAVYIPQLVTSIPNKITDVSVGHTMGSVIDHKGIIWVFGENSQGELGVGDTTARVNPYPIVSMQHKGITQVALGGGYAMAITSGNRDSKQTDSEVLKENKAMLNLKDSLAPQCEETFGVSPEEKVVTPHQLSKP